MSEMKLKHYSGPFPACMLPDGGSPCEPYQLLLVDCSPT